MRSAWPGPRCFAASRRSLAFRHATGMANSLREPAAHPRKGRDTRALHRRHASFPIWPLKDVGGGAWLRRLLILLFDAQPCAADVFSPAASAGPSASVGLEAASARRGQATGSIRATQRTRIQRHTCLNGGCGHPFPQASCRTDYAGGARGVNKSQAQKTKESYNLLISEN